MYLGGNIRWVPLLESSRSQRMLVSLRMSIFTNAGSSVDFSFVDV